MPRLASRIFDAALRVLPQSDRADRLVAFVMFLWAHRRLPKRRALLFNDVLYGIKSGDEIVNPLRVFVSDKEFVKLYVKALIGDRFNVPTLAVLRTWDAVQAYDFPGACCIKPTHMSGEVILRRGGEPIAFDEIRRWFGASHYRRRRERNYKALQPKVIVEPLLFGSDCLTDYKIFCHRGEPRLVQIDLDRHVRHTRKFLDLEWNELPFSLLYPRASRPVARPANFDQMLSVAAALSRHFDFVRVDLYSDGTDCFVGEITNCHGNAEEPFLPRSGEDIASKLIFGAG